MKLAFVQDGMDRSSEIDEWIALLQEQQPPAKAERKTPAETDHARGRTGRCPSDGKTGAQAGTPPDKEAGKGS